MSFGSRKEKAKNIIEDKEYRDFYTETYLKKSIPFQMRTMRTERNWSQTFAAAEILGKGQNALSRLESPTYGRLTIQTLLEVAKAYDVGLVVKFVPFSKLLEEYEDVSFAALSAPSPTDKFKDEIQAIWKWADEREDRGFWEGDSQTKINENTEPQLNRLIYHREISAFGYVKAGSSSPDFIWQNSNETKTFAKTLNMGNTQNIIESV